MRSERYTETQVLCGLREAWEMITGVDDPFDADNQIDTFMKTVIRGTKLILPTFSVAWKGSFSLNAPMTNGRTSSVSRSQNAAWTNGTELLLRS